MEDPIGGDPKNEDEKFKLMFLNMQRVLEELYNEKKKRDETFSSKDPKESKKRKDKGVDHGKEPLEPPLLHLHHLLLLVMNQVLNLNILRRILNIHYRILL